MNDILEILNDLIVGKITEKEASEKLYQMMKPKKKTKKDLSLIHPFNAFIRKTNMKVYVDIIMMFLNLILMLAITIFSIYCTILLFKIFS